MKILSKKRGFTLIELIIVISIIVIISGIAIVNVAPYISDAFSFREEKEAEELMQSINSAKDSFKLEGVDLSDVREEDFVLAVKRYTDLPVVTLAENKANPSDENWIIGTVIKDVSGNEMFLSYSYAFNINNNLINDIMSAGGISWTPVPLNYGTKFAVATNLSGVSLSVNLPLVGDTPIPGTESGSIITKSMLTDFESVYIMKSDYSVME